MADDDGDRIHRCDNHKIEGWRPRTDNPAVMWYIPAQPVGFSFVNKVTIDIEVQYCPWCGEKL